MRTHTYQGSGAYTEKYNVNTFLLEFVSECLAACFGPIIGVIYSDLTALFISKKV